MSKWKQDTVGVHQNMDDPRASAKTHMDKLYRLKHGDSYVYHVGRNFVKCDNRVKAAIRNLMSTGKITCVQRKVATHEYWYIAQGLT